MIRYNKLIKLKKINFILLIIINLWLLILIGFLFKIFAYIFVLILAGVFHHFRELYLVFFGESTDLGVLFETLFYITYIYFLFIVIRCRKELNICLLNKIEKYQLNFLDGSLKKTDLIKFKAIISFSLIYILMFFIGWKLSDFTKTIEVLTICIYLLTPIVAIWAYIDWKSPKQYELEKQYAEKLLENINEVYFYIFERVNNLKYLSDINTHVVLLNGLSRNTKKYSGTPFYLAHGYIELLNSIAKKQIDKSFLINFERMTQLLDSQSNYIEEKYIVYYESLPDELKKNHSITFASYDNIVLNHEQRVAKYQLNRYLTEQLDSEAIEENGEVITFNLTYKEYIDKFKEEYELLVKEIVVNYIKIEVD